MKPQYGAGWRAVRAEVLARDDYRCRIRLPGCKVVATEVDHVVPLVDGGARLDPLNLRAACKPCNVARGNMMRARPVDPPHAGPSREW